MTGVIMQVRSLVSVAQFETGLTGTPYATSRRSIAVNSKLKMANNPHGSFSIKSDLPIGFD